MTRTEENNLPTASVEHRGRILSVFGSNDSLYVCSHNGSVYSWISLLPDTTRSSGTTAQRSSVSVVGFMYFDTTIGKPIYWEGASWVDAAGTVV